MQRENLLREPPDRHQNPRPAGPVAPAALVETLAPLLFGTCPHRAHRKIEAARESVKRRIHAQFRRRFVALQQNLAAGKLSHESNAEMLQLDALHGPVRQLPVWPAGTQVVAQIVLSFALPLGLPVLQVALERASIEGRWQAARAQREVETVHWRPR